MNLSFPSRFALLAGCGWLALGASPAFADTDEIGQDSARAGSGNGQDQANGAPEEPNDSNFGSGSSEASDQIIVSAERLRGQLDVEQAPILELNELDIAAEGVTSIADLITQISNQTGSARGRGGGGRPVVLINGIRVSSFREFANYPPEALARVEVFPEEVAQRFGFPPDRRVINLILKENYRNAEVEFEFEGPARGGSFFNEQEIGFLQIADGARINLNLEASDNSLLTEDERDIIQTEGSTPSLASDPDPAAFRSLVADSRSIEANASYAKSIIGSGTLIGANLNYNRSDRRSLQGLNSVLLTDDPTNPDAAVLRTFGEETPLETITAQDTFSTSGSMSRPISAFRLTSTFNASLSETTQFIDQRFDTSGFQEAALAGTLALDAALPSSADAGFETAFTRSISAETLNTLRGPLLNLPGGELLATFDVGGNWQQIESNDTRTLGETDLDRTVLTTGANLVIPITSRRIGFADALGSFTLNLNTRLNDVSDVETLGSYTVGLTWSPFDNLDLSANYIEREVSPSLNALGAPLVERFNTPVFDFTTGETVLATVISGGNPSLLPETQRDWKFAANWELPFWQGTRFTAEYIRNRSDDVTSGFPLITPEIEAAFPDRIVRDASGTLLSVDSRQVTFDQTRAERLRFSLNFRGSIGAGNQRGGPPQGARGGGGRPSQAGGAQRPPASSEPRPGTQGPPAAARGGPPGGGERRAAFMRLRERICADDGLEVLTQLANAIENGEDVSEIIGDIPPLRLQGLLARARDENGQIDPERLAMMRERLCSMDPAAMGGRPGGPSGAGQAGPPAGPTGGPGGRPEGGPRGEGFEAFRNIACAEDGEARLRALIARIDAGEDVSDELPGFDPNMASFVIDRLRNEDGSLSSERIAGLRARFCEAEGQGGQGGGQGDGQQGGQQGRGGPPGGFNPLAQRNFPGFRYFVSLNHTIELENQIFIAPGLAPLDQLDGQATGAFGLPRHTSRLEAGIFGNGIGMRLSGRYTGSATLEGSGLPGTSDLSFDDLATFDIRVFSDIGRLVSNNEGPLKNVRISLRMDNIFDGQRRVTDANGETPLNYQPFLIDPLGRYVGIDLRKLF